MNEFPPKGNLFSRDAGDRLVRIWALDEDGETFRPFSFATAAIDGVMGLGEKRSALVLRSGMKIPVALSHEELEQKIYTHDFREPVLDLCKFTGAAVAPLQFQPQLKIKAFVRQADTYNVVTYDFSEASITSIEAIETSRSKSGKAVRLSFNKAAKNYPFGGAQAVLDMSYDDYIAFLTEAKKRGFDTLDLCQPFRDNPKKYGLNPK
jgi:hypothetical protein